MVFASKTASRAMYEEVYRIVSKIPMGKVMTYGEIAKKVKSQSQKSKSRFLARVVGNALHKNQNPDVPCHRVVDRNGRLAQNYAFGGVMEQRRRLVEEGVKFKNRMCVNLEKCLWEVN